MEPFGVYLSAKVLKCSLCEILKPSLLPFIATFSMLLTMWLSIRAFSEIDLISFAAIGIIGAGTYILTIYLFDKVFDYGFRKNIRELLMSVTNR